MCDVLVGGTPNRRRPEYWAANDGAGHTWVTISDLNQRTITSSAERITDLGVANSKVKLVPAGAVLASYKLTIGRVAVVDEPLYTNEGIVALVPGEQVDRAYLVQVLPSLLAGATKNATSRGATLTRATIVDLPLPLPSLEKQKRIAAILSSVDHVVAATEAVVESLARVCEGLAASLIRGAAGAATTRLGDVAALVTGHTFKSSDWSTAGLPIIRTANLNGSGVYHYFAGRPKEAWLVRPGALLLCWAGAPGKSLGPRVWGGQVGVLNQHIFRVEFDERRIDRDYLVAVLREVTRELTTRAHGFNGRLLHLRRGELLDARIAVRSLIDQKRLGEKVRKVEESLQANRDQLARLGALKNYLLQELLAEE